MADSEDNAPKGRFLFSPAGIVLIGFLAIAGFYLVTEHQAHLYGVLPWLLILACPLMHLFMHHGHGGHDHDQSRASSGDRDVPSHHH